MRHYGTGLWVLALNMAYLLCLRYCATWPVFRCPVDFIGSSCNVGGKDNNADTV